MHGRGDRSESDHRDSHRHRHFYPYGYPYYSWYADPFYLGGDYQNSGYSDSYSEQDGSVVTDPNRYDQAPSPEDNGLQRDVQALSGKIDRLQADVEARNAPKSDPEPLTALVFRDQHVLEVRNYAISGGTLWVMSEQGAKKIPLSQLDLDATAKMNDDRGVDFQVPK
jgi:predicted TIM-barrel fold metal-dependent hydrolase